MTRAARCGSTITTATLASSVLSHESTARHSASNCSTKKERKKERKKRENEMKEKNEKKEEKKMLKAIKAQSIAIIFWLLVFFFFRFIF